MKTETFSTTEFDGKARRCTWRECELCNKSFLFPATRKPVQRYCSAKCMGEARRTWVSKECPVCKKEFSRPIRILNQVKGASCCSKACRNLAQAIGSGVDVYRPHTYGKANGRSEAGRIRKSITHGSSCASCGISFPGVLTMHHIDGDENNNSKENLETVCFLHHATRHMKLVNGAWIYNTHSLTPRSFLSEIEKMILESKKETLHLIKA